MRGLMFVVGLVVLFVAAGCEGLRFAPGEVQKANAYLHHRTAQMAADTARAEGTSAGLVELTSLSEVQSRAFMADYGLPRELPAAETVDDILNEGSRAIAEGAAVISGERPDGWAVADCVVEAAIGIAGIIGGVWGIRAGQFLRRSRETSLALREVILGNEAFKRAQSESAAAFKESQSHQSATTRRLVSELKTG